jgi:uncharacterized protein
MPPEVPAAPPPVPVEVPVETADPASVHPDQASLAVIGHLLPALSCFLLGGFGMGWLCFLPSLGFWVWLRDRGPYLRQHSTAVLNFAITASAAIAVCGVIPCLQFLLYPAALITTIIFSVLGTLDATKRKLYDYRLSFKLVQG